MTGAGRERGRPARAWPAAAARAAGLGAAALHALGRRCRGSGSGHRVDLGVERCGAPRRRRRLQDAEPLVGDRGAHRLGHVGGGDRHQLARLQDRDHLDDGQRARLFQRAEIDQHRRVQEHVRQLRDPHAQLAVDQLDVRAAQAQHGQRRHVPLRSNAAGALRRPPARQILPVTRLVRSQPRQVHRRLILGPGCARQKSDQARRQRSRPAQALHTNGGPLLGEPPRHGGAPPAAAQRRDRLPSPPCRPTPSSIAIDVSAIEAQIC